MIEALFSNNTYVAEKALLDATYLRHQAIASNLANVETPGYKRVDLPTNFAEEFAAQLKAGKAASITLPALEEDRTAVSTRFDGNNVEIEKELLLLSNNMIQADTVTEFVSSSLKQLRLAITGRTM